MEELKDKLEELSQNVQKEKERTKEKEQEVGNHRCHNS